MDNFFFVATQVGVLFSLMAVGALCRKFRLLDEASVKGVVNVLVLVVTPCLIVDCFQRPFDPASLRSMGMAFAVAIAAHLALVAFATAAIRHRDERVRAVLRLAVVFSNAGFMGIPLEQSLFGADGEKLPDEQLQDYIAQNGCMTVKHILLSTVDENNAPLPDEVKAQKHTQAARIIERLRAIDDPNTLLSEFDRYASEYNEDPGVAQYPNGYCFTSGQMDAAFEAASAALQPYEVSPEPVESAYGYHVILRLPTTGDDVMDFNADGTPYTLRSAAAQATYTTLAHAWIHDAKVEWAEGFEHLDVQKLFTKPETFWDKIDVFHWFH